MERCFASQGILDLISGTNLLSLLNSDYDVLTEELLRLLNTKNQILIYLSFSIYSFFSNLYLAFTLKKSLAVFFLSYVHLEKACDFCNNCILVPGKFEYPRNLIYQ